MVSLDGTACVPFVYPHFISPRTTDKEDQADPTMNDCCRSVRMEIILMDYRIPHMNQTGRRQTHNQAEGRDSSNIYINRRYFLTIIKDRLRRQAYVMRLEAVR